LTATDASTGDMDELDATELFHEGERRVQARAGVSDVAVRVGRGAMGTDLDRGLAVFLAERLFLVAGAQAPDGRIWASLLVGPPGFVRALDSREVTAEQRAVVRRSDTAFVASAHS
jgi:predicted pyridoxine 5'-phosphate oxidase superfamily flavin-nucleotide-binding protein